MEIKIDKPLFFKRADGYIATFITTLAIGEISNSYDCIVPRNGEITLTDTLPSNIQDKGDNVS